MANISDTPDIARTVEAAYDAYINQYYATQKGIPSIPGYRQTFGDTRYSIESPYPRREEGNSAPVANLSMLRNAVIGSISGGQPVPEGAFWDMLKSSEEAGELSSTQASTLATAFMQWSYDHTSDTHAALVNLLTETFPDSRYNASERLRIEIERLLIPGVPQETAPYNNTIAVNIDGSSPTIQAVALEHITPNTNVILPVPFYFGYPLVADYLNAPLLTIDTQDSHYKLTPQALEETIKAGNVKPGDWLIFTNPDNLTMSPYSQEELQALAVIMAKYELNILSDELYANVGTGEHCSLTSIQAHDPNGYKLADHIITVSGNSKQIDSNHKFGVACGPPHMMGNIQRHLDQSQFMIDERSADIHANTLALITPEVRRKEQEAIAASYRVTAQTIEEINAALGQDALVLNGSSNGHLATLSLSPKLLARSGITNSADLQQYILATTGISTHPLDMMGIEAPIVRINTTQFARNPEAIKQRLSNMAREIENDEGPPIGTVRAAFANLVRQQGRTYS
ncbi:MAG TPA: aminotransferase class I/II-fold pyridoxal phosphate-dependent enzyme [Rickettsiales bacterium]|nr:aminotransferase class I/II-fold pyridoxal phosphate-dependent enzyme [Rickettsiales bacterium]